jgi:hypothetical protein
VGSRTLEFLIWYREQNMNMASTNNMSPPGSPLSDQ